MFSTNFSKICCSFAQNKIFERTRWRPRWRTFCETTVAIATVLYQNLTVVMESNNSLPKALHAKA